MDLYWNCFVNSVMNTFVCEQFQSRCEMVSFSSPQEVHLGSSEIFILFNKWLVGSIL